MCCGASCRQIWSSGLEDIAPALIQPHATYGMRCEGPEISGLRCSIRADIADTHYLLQLTFFSRLEIL
jgi:hypothetical protein